MPRYCANLKAIRYESTSLNRIVDDKSHRVILASSYDYMMRFISYDWFYWNSLIHILSLSDSHNNVASIQKNRDDRLHRVIVALGMAESNQGSRSGGGLTPSIFAFFAKSFFFPQILAIISLQPPHFSVTVCTIYRVSQKKNAKLIKRNLKLIKSIHSMWLFFDSEQSNSNFEPSSIGIHQILIEIWLFEHKFLTKNFDQLRMFEGIKFVNKLFIKLLDSISRFQLKSKWEGRNSDF